jgi:MarR-like DNA-binding transcriptional regulator SgrR of sgrS sRNA
VLLLHIARRVPLGGCVAETSVPQLAKQIRRSERQVRRIIAQLEDGHHLEVEHPPGRASVYTLKGYVPRPHRQADLEPTSPNP